MACGFLDIFASPFPMASVFFAIYCFFFQTYRTNFVIIISFVSFICSIETIRKEEQIGLSIQHAIRAYHWDKDALPENLEALTPRYLKTISSPRFGTYKYQRYGKEKWRLTWGVFGIKSVSMDKKFYNDHVAGLTNSSPEKFKISAIKGRVIECKTQLPVKNVQIVAWIYESNMIETWISDEKGDFFLPRLSLFSAGHKEKKNRYNFHGAKIWNKICNIGQTFRPSSHLSGRKYFKLLINFQMSLNLSNTE